MKAIWKRELQGYFCTAAGYVYLFVFLTVSSVLFYLEILSQRSGELPTFIGEMSYLWMLLSPVLTMRLLAEERQKKKDRPAAADEPGLPAEDCSRQIPGGGDGAASCNGTDPVLCGDRGSLRTGLSR